MMGQMFTPDAFEEAGGGPLYLQLHRLIAEAIASGRLQPGDSLPSERELAAMTGLSRVTVRKGVAELVASGQLVQKRGSGTFVAPRVEKLEQALSLLTSFTEDMARRGRSVESRWIARGRAICRWLASAGRTVRAVFFCRRTSAPSATCSRTPTCSRT